MTEAIDAGQAEVQGQPVNEEGAEMETEEARRPKICRRPLAPTKEMVEEHNRTHAEYRDWCPDCRAGKSVGAHHRQGNPLEEKLGTTISIDFAFRLREEQEDDLIPVLVAHDNVKKSIWTLEVEEKGISNGSVAVDWLVDKLDASGYCGVGIALKSDNEPSIMAMKDAVALRRKGETSLIESTVRESKGNAHVERAIRTWRDQFRTLRHYTERRFGCKIPRDSPLMGWLVSWASEVLNRYKIQSNGRTAFEMATLHKCRHKVAAFAEKVYFQHTHTGKEDDRKDVGVFVGMMSRSPTYLVANASGVYASPNIAAFPDEQAFDSELALSVTVKQCEYIDKGVSGPPKLRVVPASAPAAVQVNPEVRPVETAGGDYAPRRARILKSDLLEHGYTVGCPACVSARLDDGIRRGGHTEECRKRIENLMNDKRVQQAKERIDAWAADKVEQGEQKAGEDERDNPPRDAQGDEVMGDGADPGRCTSRS